MALVITAPVMLSTAGPEADDRAEPAAESGGRFSVLVFSKTAGFRHDSIPEGVTAISKLGTKHGFEARTTEDAAIFTDAGLAPFAAIVFLSTTGDILDDEQQAAFERYIRGGGGFVGVHAATDTEYDWPWYGRLVGAYFKGHPAVQDAVILVTDRAHPSTRFLPKRWTRRDEWYDFRESPRRRVRVLAALDERTYEGGGMGDDHPFAWCHEFDGGRAWYTGGGHTRESFREPFFLRHILGGIHWAAAVAPGDAGPDSKVRPGV
ncbi:MAG: ThuA domain-containing protein [Planctomycetota bacterium]|jgi:type 1 glutamine amidotransferase